MSKKVKVKELIEEFNLEILSGDEKAFEREVLIADTNRPGLELAGYYDYTQLKRLVLLGDKEIEYIKTMSTAQKQSAFDFISSNGTPAIIIARKHECPEELLAITSKKNFPVLRTELQTGRITINLVSYLDERLARSDCFHGVLLSMYGKGVLIRGESGIGKSEVALELLRRGHQLVADDRVDCVQVHNKVYGKAPKILEGMLEIRGIGIIDVARMYGANTTLSKSEVDVVIELASWDNMITYDRVGIEATKYDDFLGVEIPKIILPVREGRSMGIVIESAVSNIILKENGFDSAKEFEQRVLDYIACKNRED